MPDFFLFVYTPKKYILNENLYFTSFYSSGTFNDLSLHWLFYLSPALFVRVVRVHTYSEVSTVISEISLLMLEETIKSNAFLVEYF